MIKFDNDTVVKGIRRIYNGIKHRGIMYFQGFGEATLFKFLFDKSIEMPLQREVYDPDKIQDLLLAYHEKFENYFNELIHIIMPEDYKDNNVHVIKYIDVMAEKNSGRTIKERSEYKM